MANTRRNATRRTELMANNVETKRRRNELSYEFMVKYIQEVKKDTNLLIEFLTTYSNEEFNKNERIKMAKVLFIERCPEIIESREVVLSKKDEAKSLLAELMSQAEQTSAKVSKIEKIEKAS